MPFFPPVPHETASVVKHRGLLASTRGATHFSSVVFKTGKSITRTAIDDARSLGRQLSYLQQGLNFLRSYLALGLLLIDLQAVGTLCVRVVLIKKWKIFSVPTHNYGSKSQSLSSGKNAYIVCRGYGKLTRIYTSGARPKATAVSYRTDTKSSKARSSFSANA